MDQTRGNETSYAALSADVARSGTVDSQASLWGPFRVREHPVEIHSVLPGEKFTLVHLKDQAGL